jgi:hypothetical protein
MSPQARQIRQPELGAYINCAKWQHARSQCGNAEPGRDLSVGMHDNRSLTPARTWDNWASLVLSKAVISRPYNVFAVDSFEPAGLNRACRDWFDKDCVASHR